MNTPNTFALDRRLAADTLPLCQTDVCLLLVARDARFPWLILAPKLPGMADLVDLDSATETKVLGDVRGASLALRAATKCDKLNIASLGNQVRQLHIHIVARFEGDAAWPGPIWGVGDAELMDALPPWALQVREQLGWTYD